MVYKQITLFDKFYQLCEVLDDDVSDVSIIISEMMYRGGLIVPLTAVRRDCQSPTVDNLEKYEDFMEDALDTPIVELKQIINNKLAVTRQKSKTIEELRAQVKELRAKLAEYDKKQNDQKIAIHGSGKKKQIAVVKSLFEGMVE